MVEYIFFIENIFFFLNRIFFDFKFGDPDPLFNETDTRIRIHFLTKQICGSGSK